MYSEWENLLSLIPVEPGQKILWTDLQKTILAEYFSRMSQTPQESAKPDGPDVYTHTKMVCEKLITFNEFWALNKRKRQELFVAALLHDIAKPEISMQQDENTATIPHDVVGALMVRSLLWTAFDLAGSRDAQQFRETVCMLIRYHTLPVHLMDNRHPAWILRRISADGVLIPDFSIDMLCLLARANVLGNENSDTSTFAFTAADTKEQCERISVCALQAKKAGCLLHPFVFPDAYTAHAYYSGRRVLPGSALQDDTWGEVIMLCGLPGTGKDTWIAKNLPDLPMVSLDQIREEFHAAPTGAQEPVVREGKRRARVLMEKHQPFVLNATNITYAIRNDWISLFEQYHAHVRIVYLETAWKENLRRNSERSRVVPEYAISQMLNRFTLPEIFEAQYVEWNTL